MLKVSDPILKKKHLDRKKQVVKIDDSAMEQFLGN